MKEEIQVPSGRVQPLIDPGLVTCHQQPGVDRCGQGEVQVQNALVSSYQCANVRAGVCVKQQVIQLVQAPLGSGFALAYLYAQPFVTACKASVFSRAAAQNSFDLNRASFAHSDA